MLTSMHRTILLKLSIVALISLLAFVIGLFVMASHSVLYRYFETGNPVREPAITIFNPFRDRTPERQAEAFLTRLQTGDCQSAFAELSHGTDYKQRVCEKEKENALTSWRLRNRTDNADAVRLYYIVGRTKYHNTSGSVWITVVKQGEEWGVTTFETFY